MAQLPCALSVTVLPVTLHAVDEVENVTGLPDPPRIAVSVNGGSVAIRSGSAAKSIACAALAIVSVLEPALATYPSSPANDAATPPGYVPALMPAMLAFDRVAT